MDADLARTFLCIAREGSFVAASKHLHITQTAVTARVQNLEEQLGCRLFVRNRAGARLTDDGKRFLTYATLLVQTWEAARRDLPLPDGYGDLITLGGEMSVCNPLMLNWATKLKEEIPSHAVRIEVASGTTLQEKLEHGLINAALVYKPEYWPNVQVEHLMDEKLIQVSSLTSRDPYIWVDWGEGFKLQHDAALPDKAKSSLSFNLGPLALQYILQCGGTGYFRARVVQSYLDSGLLEKVESAPQFSYPIYLVYPREKFTPVLEKALDILRSLVAEQPDWSQRWAPESRLHT
jgi:DNA-binding transcriptional LysR family regulator